MRGKFVKIIDIDRAKELGIEELKVDEEKGLLMINIAVIPHNFSVESYLDYLVDNNVILVDSYGNKNRPKE